ncbi:MAG: hypothetical protein FWF88_03560 [Peptococcaceae bacterium]|nr:hypothetical protein [Peptococcaceae bacterium]
MRKQPFYYLIALIFMSSLFAGCQKPQTAHFASNADKILVNSQRSDTLSFRLTLFTKSRIADVSFAGWEDSRLKDAGYQAEVIDSNNDTLNNYGYKDLFVKYLTIIVTPPENVVGNCKISAILLNVDGKPRRIAFKTPLKHAFTGGYIATKSFGFVIPSEVAARVINSQEALISLELVANEDLVLNKVSFLDFIEAANIKLSINDQPVKEAAFPLNLEKGDTVNFSISVVSAIADSFSYVSTNIVFEYTSIEDGTTHSGNSCLSFDPVYLPAGVKTSEIDAWIDDLFFQ